MSFLAVETAYDVCGVALVSNAGLEALEEQVSPRRHNEILAPMVQRLLAKAGCQISDLDGIALSIGPGSYTGLRVGMSYIKGLAFAHDLPVIPVPTLPALLEGERIEKPDWIATWSHGCNVYTMHVEQNNQRSTVQFMSWDEFVQHAAGQTIAGYQLERFQSHLDISIVEICPSAAKVGKFALARRLAPAPDLANLVCAYHHEFEARLSCYANSGSK